MEDISTYFGQIHRAARDIATAESHEVGLGRGEWRILHFIGRHPGTTQQAISSKYGINKAATARQCASLEEKGLICRIKNENDGRSRLLYLTNKAMAIRDKAHTDMEIIHEKFMAGMTAAEKEELARLLEKMCRNIPCDHNDLS